MTETTNLDMTAGYGWMRNDFQESFVTVDIRKDIPWYFGRDPIHLSPGPLKEEREKNGNPVSWKHPEIQADFRNLPFRNGQFSKILFDPPFLARNDKKIPGLGSRIGTYYRKGWTVKDNLRLSGLLYRGFREGLRVLRDDGILYFKWSDVDHPLNWAMNHAPPELKCYGMERHFAKHGPARRPTWIVRLMRFHTNTRDKP